MGEEYRNTSELFCRSLALGSAYAQTRKSARQLKQDSREGKYKITEELHIRYF
jgi:hypothetical protein